MSSISQRPARHQHAAGDLAERQAKMNFELEIRTMLAIEDRRAFYYW
jgi:hypothetical protein